MAVKWFGIYRISDGELIADETDTAGERLTDDELAAKGLKRVAIPHQMKITETWNKTAKQIENL